MAACCVSSHSHFVPLQKTTVKPTLSSDMPPPLIDPNLEQIVAEDLDYLDALVQQEHVGNAEIRRSSVVLRRLIYEDHLQQVASARLHPITVPVPDTRTLIHNINADDKVLFFQLGGYQALGVDVACMIIERGAGARPRSFDPNATYDAPLKTYKRQPVFFVRAVLETPTETRPAVMTSGAISRESVIKYVAHKAGGAHYDAHRATKNDELLDVARRAASTTSTGGVSTFMMNSQVFENPLVRAQVPLPGIGPVARDHLDPVLLELLGAARFLVDSPSVRLLRELI